MGESMNYFPDAWQVIDVRRDGDSFVLVGVGAQDMKNQDVATLVEQARRRYRVDAIEPTATVAKVGLEDDRTVYGVNWFDDPAKIEVEK